MDECTFGEYVTWLDYKRLHVESEQKSLALTDYFARAIFWAIDCVLEQLEKQVPGDPKLSDVREFVQTMIGQHRQT